MRMRVQTFASIVRNARKEREITRTRVAQLQQMIIEFQKMIQDLDGEIRADEERSGIRDPSHFAYPIYAKTASARRENLSRSFETMQAMLPDAQSAMKRAEEALEALLALEVIRAQAQRVEADAS